jgi:hypothetical protein
MNYKTGTGCGPTGYIRGGNVIVDMSIIQRTLSDGRVEQHEAVTKRLEIVWKRKREALSMNWVTATETKSMSDVMCGTVNGTYVPCSRCCIRLGPGQPLCRSPRDYDRGSGSGSI